MNDYDGEPMNNKFCCVARKYFSHFFAFSFLSFATIFGANPMEPTEIPYEDRVEILYDIREADSLKPYEFKITNDNRIHLFPVPQDASVGTNEVKNAITIFTFDKGKMRDKTYFRNAVSGMSPGGQYTSLFSKDAIGYGMTRGFTLFDFKRNKFKDFTIHTSIERDIDEIRATDGERKLFLFQSTEDNPESEKWEDSLGFLRLFDLSGDKPILLKKMQLQNYEVWNVHHGLVFICDFRNYILKVFNSRLEPSTHPLADIIKKNKGTASFVMIEPHPTLPFAVFYGGGKRAQYTCWNQTFREEKIKSIFSIDESTLYYSFSPDGKWVVFLANEYSPKRSYIMPISEKYPNYLGSPILLEGDYFDRDYFAWTDNPVNLVGSSRGKLLLYDLTKENHPETGDKPSFWDYVVDRDLERLRKAGKQGLRPLKPEESK